MMTDAATAASYYGELKRRILNEVYEVCDRADAETNGFLTADEVRRTDLLIGHAQEAGDKQSMFELRARCAAVSAEFSDTAA